MTYCSLDLELTGFDPLEDEILEIGLAFFEPTETGLRVTEQWSQVFKPKTEVHPKILGLTGINAGELESAPSLSELHEQIQNKLNDAVIVGHNTVLDAKFLESFGFHLSGQFIDTLDLVQFLLPTHHSYNLENLMHYFGIAHEEAHRAQGDSLATIALLEQLIKLYKNFPETALVDIRKLISGQKFLWQKLFEYNFNFSDSVPQPQSASLSAQEGHQPAIDSGTLVIENFDQITPDHTIQSLSADPSKYLLVISDKTTILQLWRQGLVQGVFGSQDRFNKNKFDHLLQQPLTPEQTMFCLKILVWLHTNWQTETIIDLNLSFFGGQFRTLINDQPLQEQVTPAIICCDYETFATLSQAKLYTKRIPVLWSAHRLEQWLSEGSQGRLSWSQVIYLLKSIYNPETKYGQVDLQKPVVDALAAADLFFGLVNLMIRNHFKGEQYVTYQWLASNDLVLHKIESAAANFVVKIETVTAGKNFPELQKFTQALRNFFVDSPQRIKWVEAGETNCVFVDRSLHIAPALENMLQPYSLPVVVENIPDRHLLDYLMKRLGLSTRTTVINSETALISYQVKCNIVPNPAESQRLISLVQPDSLPAVIIFSDKAQVRSLYDQNYMELKQFAHLFAQSYSGGSNKVLRNFGIRPASLLLATPSFIIRGQKPLTIKTLIIAGLPELDSKHPYIQALKDFWQKDFPDFESLQSSLQLYLLLQLVVSSSLENILIFMPNSNQEVVSHLKNLPFLSFNSEN